MSTPIRVSVLLPSYNCAHQLDDAIASVVQQSFGDFELLLCDDGSTDGSAELAQAWAKRDPRIQVFCQAHQGSVAALNALYARARGEYVALLGPKDRFTQHHLAKSVSRLDAEPSCVGAFSAVEVCDSTGAPRPTLQASMATPSETTMEGAQLAQALMAGNCLQMPTALLRKSATDKLEVFLENYEHVHAWSLWLRLALQGCLSFVNERGARSLLGTGHNARERQKAESYESLILIEAIMPQLVQHYGLGEAIWGRLHGVMGAHAMLAEQPGRALVHLATKAKHEGLNEGEKVCLMQCLATTNRIGPARDLAVLLHAERYALKPETCEALDATSRAMGWDLYTDASQAKPDKGEATGRRLPDAGVTHLPAP